MELTNNYVDGGRDAVRSFPSMTGRVSLQPLSQIATRTQPNRFKTKTYIVINMTECAGGVNR